ncbi:MAG: M13 family metallopeptidase [Thermoanaerobaculia bacterium]
MTVRTPLASALALLVLAGPAGAASLRSGIEPSGMDPSVRPQDDFFRWVNGGWIEATKIPADRSSYGSAHQLIEASEAAQKEILDELAAGDAAEGTLERKLGDYWVSYLDETTIETRGLEPLAGDLARLAALDDAGSLLAELARLERLGVSGPFGVYIDADYDDSTRYLLRFAQAGLSLPDRDYYLSDEAEYTALREALVAYASTLLELAGRPVAEARTAAATILDLETRLARAQWSAADAQDITKTANRFTPAALGELAPGLPWGRYLEGIGTPGVAVVNVDEPSYLTAAAEALADVPLPVWRDYLSYRLLDAFAPHLPAAFVEASFVFHGEKVSGLEELPARWKRGVRHIDDAMGEGLGKLYVARHFPPEAKRRMDELVANLLAAMAAGIDDLDWMSAATKEQARRKLATIRPYIGYPDRWRDYSALEIRRGDHLGNVRRATEFEHDRQARRIDEPVDRDEWGLTPQTVNAYYSPTRTKIVFPAAILQPPFFDLEADDAVNYGAIGAVIGHEISHGFDDSGRRYDEAGNLRDWWTPADAAAFEERSARLVAQYDAFEPLPGLHVNGRLTLGENIADLAGLTVALAAYRRSLGGEPGPVIDGYTALQRFFIGFGQIWRSKMRDEYLRMIVVSDEHSPGRYRVDGVLPNMPDFLAAFEVEPGDGMYRPAAERTKIW